MLETLSGKSNVILRVMYVMWYYMLTLPLSEDYYISFYGLYNVVSGNYSVQIPPEGKGSIGSASLRKFNLTFVCDMGLPCSTSNNSKSI